MINILEVIPNPNDATSFYRGRLPLLRLQKQFPDKIMIHPYHNGTTNWDYILLFDLVFIQRPADVYQFRVLSSAKNMGIPVWVDYDDLLCCIPKDNPAHDAYNSEKIDLIGDFIKYADIVTVSTRALKHYLEQFYKLVEKDKIKVIPNSFDLEIFNKNSVFRRSKNIMWRGSHTHTNDIMEYSDEIISIMTQKKDWRINFYGYNPFFITNKTKNSTYIKSIPIDKYIGILHKLNNSICIVPLHDNAFNHSKSNIAWQEATYAGAVCLAPNWEEWNKPGIINYENKADFKIKLKAMIKGEYDLKRMHQKSWQFICNNLNLQKVNKLREEIIMHSLE